MGQTSTVIYNGSLRTEATHLRSGTQIITDAPTDNNGKGEAFSPTDLVATALASCMITIMGIKAVSMGVDIEGAHASILKVMSSGPRKISEIVIKVDMPKKAYDKKDKKILEKAALTCPVAMSLHPDIVQDISFHWPA
jgi:putative redox protein